MTETWMRCLVAVKSCVVSSYARISLHRQQSSVLNVVINMKHIIINEQDADVVELIYCDYRLFDHRNK